METVKEVQKAFREARSSMNARQIKDAMREYVAGCHQTSGIRALKQLIHELEDEAGEDVADRIEV